MAFFFNGRKKRKDFLQVASNCEFCKTMMYRIQIAPFLCTPSAKKVKVTRNNLQWNFLMLFEHTFASIFLFFISLLLLFSFFSMYIFFSRFVPPLFLQRTWMKIIIFLNLTISFAFSVRSSWQIKYCEEFSI